MKKLMIVAFVAAMALGATSCKKCTTCTYEISGQTVSSGEVCGSKDEIKTFEDNWKATAALGGATNVKCD